MITAADHVRPVPPLQNGDHLTPAEYERRYEASSPGTRAELIGGVVYVSPPRSHGWHGLPHADLITLLGNYRAETPGVTGGDNSTLRLDTGSLPQPDAYLMVDPACGGQVALDADLNIVGAPELIAEVAGTSASYDLHEKLDAYRRNGVGEYLVWRTYDRHFDHFVLQHGRFEAVPSPGDGIIRSSTFPGLRLYTAALSANQLSAALAEVRRGLSSAEHAAFVADLGRRRLVNPA